MPGSSLPIRSCVEIQNDFHRHALHDLGEIAGGVIWRQQGEFLAAGRGNAIDRAGDLEIRKTVHRDMHRLPRQHAGDLRLFVIRGDEDLADRDHRHDLRAGLQIIPHRDGLVTDHAIERGANLGVAEIKRGLLRPREGLRKACLRLRQLGFQHVHLPCRAGGIGLVRVQGRLRDRQIGICLVRALLCAGAAAGQAGIAPRIQPGEGELRQVALHQSGRAGDFRPLQRNLRVIA